jgi:hypothetical protein
VSLLPFCFIDLTEPEDVRDSCFHCTVEERRP